MHYQKPFSWVGYIKAEICTLKRGDTLLWDAQTSVRVNEVQVNGKKYSFYQKNSFLYIPFQFKENERYSVKIHFLSFPPESDQAPWKGGYVWKALPDGNFHAGIACQEEGASLWWPCKDDWSDKADSGMVMVISGVPEGHAAISNGRRISTLQEEQGGVWKWKVQLPIHPYNINITLGPFSHWADTLNSVISNSVLSMDYYVLRQDSARAYRHFQQIKPMMRCLEEYLGRYPFYEDGYKIVQTPYLGMEHQSAVAYGNEFRVGYRGDTAMTGGLPFDFILLHETIHEWFGNSVTAADISEMWIHEAFTTWAESWYAACCKGTSMQEKYIRAMQYRILNDRPMIGEKEQGRSGSSDMYAKGALMLQGLKYLLKNPSSFDSLARWITQRFCHRNIDTREIIRLLQPHSSLSVGAYLFSYLHSSVPPTLVLTSEAKGLYRITWANVKKGFAFPVYINEKEKFILKYGKSKRIGIAGLEAWKKLQRGYFLYRENQS